MRYSIKTRKYGTVHFWRPDNEQIVYVSFVGEADRADRIALVGGRTDQGAPIRCSGEDLEQFEGLCQYWWRAFLRQKRGGEKESAQSKKFFEIEICLENSAFEDNCATEITRILTNAAKEIRDYGPPENSKLYDFNGNHVGYCRIRTRKE